MIDRDKIKSNLLTAGNLISNRWFVSKKIGGGAFGEIYACFDNLLGIKVAIKVESFLAKKQILKSEVPILKILQSLNYFCRFYAFGVTHSFSFLVMSLQGRNLANLQKEQKDHKFSLSTTLRLSLSIIKAIKEIHNAGYIHKDIKPSNFAMGRTEATCHTVYLLDFGLSCQYNKLDNFGDAKTIRCSGFHGTLRYASPNAHFNREIGRNDDLWSAFFMFLEMRVGNLPWSKVQNIESVGLMKTECQYNTLLKKLPQEYRLIFRYIKTLKWFSEPDYDYMIELLNKSMQRYRIKFSEPFDWEVTNHFDKNDKNVEKYVSYLKKNCQCDIINEIKYVNYETINTKGDCGICKVDKYLKSEKEKKFNETLIRIKGNEHLKRKTNGMEERNIKESKQVTFSQKYELDNNITLKMNVKGLPYRYFQTPMKFSKMNEKLKCLMKDKSEMLSNKNWHLMLNHPHLYSKKKIPSNLETLEPHKKEEKANKRSKLLHHRDFNTHVNIKGNTFSSNFTPLKSNYLPKQIKREKVSSVNSDTKYVASPSKNNVEKLYNFTKSYSTCNDKLSHLISNKLYYESLKPITKTVSTNNMNKIGTQPLINSGLKVFSKSPFRNMIKKNT